MPRPAKEKPEIKISVPETIELLICTKKRMFSGIKVPQTILKLRKGMGSPFSFDPENCTSNNYYTK